MVFNFTQQSDPLRHHELGIINRKPPLQWCTKLRFIDNNGDSNGRTIQSHEYNRLQTFPGHFIKHRIAIPPSATLTHSYYSFNKNHIISHNGNNNNSHGAQTSNSDMKYKKSSDLITNNKKRFDDSYRSEQEQQQQQPQQESASNNEIYKFITEPWPSGRHIDDKSKNLFNNINNNDNLASEKRVNYNQNSVTHSLTALVSFPGSGNTWLRYLLQQSTGKQIEFSIYILLKKLCTKKKWKKLKIKINFYYLKKKIIKQG